MKSRYSVSWRIRGSHLPQAQRELGVPLQVAAHKVVIGNADFQGGGAGLVNTGGAIFFWQRPNPENAGHGGLALRVGDLRAERPDLRSSFSGAVEQVQRTQRSFFGAGFV